MKTRSITVVSLLLLGLHPSASSVPDRNWQTAQVHQAQRTPNLRNEGDHWEYELVADKFAYILRTTSHDAPFLNSSLGTEVKIAPSDGSSAHPYDGDEVYVMDAKGQEHKMSLVSVSIADMGCKKP